MADDQPRESKVALTGKGGPRMRRWRSPAFVQPLLITIAGVVVSVVLYNVARGPMGCPSDVNADTCGYYFMGGLGQAIATLPVLLVGLLITGFLVGLLSRDYGLARRAVLVGVLVPPLVGAAFLDVTGGLASGPADAIAGTFLGAALIGLILLIPVALGLGVGRLVRPSPTDQSGATGLE